MIAPGYTKIYNLRVVKDDNIKNSEKEKTDIYRSNASAEHGLKAREVMAILKISRQTLSNYVKRGLIKVTTKFAGSKYTYDYESVMKLKK